MSEVVLLEPDEETAAEVGAVLARAGHRVSIAPTPEQARRVIGGGSISRVIATRATLSEHPDWVEDLSLTHPGIEIVEHANYGDGFVFAGHRAQQLGGMTRDALVLLGELCEQHGKRPEVTRRAAQLAEATAVAHGLAPIRAFHTSLAASLAALGPGLVSFQLGHGAVPERVDGISDGLRAALTAATLIGAPARVRKILLATEERFEGGGRPHGLSGEDIPIEARIASLALFYARRASEDVSAAADQVSSRVSTDFDPIVSEAFFQALQSDLLVSGEGGATRGRVLLASANVSVRTLAMLHLRQAGFDASTAPDGQAAFAAISSSPPDVLVADAKLPRLDGLALLLRLRRSEKLRRVPVILVASLEQGGLADRALKLGAKDVLPTPLNYDLLLAKLRALTARSAGGDLAMEGSLEQISTADCFQTLHMARRTARALVEGDAGRGEVYFQSGEPIAAYTTSAKGEPAFVEVCSWTKGTFRIVMGDVPPERNLNDGLYALLMRAAKEQDDEARGETE